MSIESIIDETEEKMLEAIEAMERDFAGFRTGKASTALVENIQVEVYGSTMRLREVAGITTPEPRLIVVQPWDKSAMGNIEKALQQSNLGISPLNDGKVIRLPVPELSEERRRDLSKQVKSRSEDAKVAIRNSRRTANDEIKKAQKNSAITEDEERDLLDQVQKLTDDYTKQIEDMTDSKATEILQV